MTPFTVESYVAWKQPHILRLIWLLWQPVEADRECRKLDRLMRQKPWPNAPEGKGKVLSPGKSCASAIAKKIAEVKTNLDRKYNGGPAAVKDPEGILKCAVCGEKLNMAEGCLVCRNCGFSKC